MLPRREENWEILEGEIINVRAESFSGWEKKGFWTWAEVPAFQGDRPVLPLSGEGRQCRQVFWCSI